MKIIYKLKSLFSKKRVSGENTEIVFEHTEPNIELMQDLITSIKGTFFEFNDGYEVFKQIVNSIRADYSNTKYTDLIRVLELAYDKYNYEHDKLYNEMYVREYGKEIALGIVLSILNNSSEGITPISWDLRVPYDEIIETSFEAYQIDSGTWEILKLYIEDSKGNEEGYSFNCVLDPKIAEIKYPDCNCGEISPTNNIIGNKISSDCDTYGTILGAKAEGLYAFYITDLKKFAVVYESYWCY